MRSFQGTSRYEKVRMIGKGGMGAVYEVVDRDRNLRLALKVLPEMDSRAIYLFKQEFRSLAGISHENLIALDELSSEGDTWFFTMEYIEGSDLVAYARPDSSPAIQTSNDEPTITVHTVTKPAAFDSAGASSTSNFAHRPCDYLRLRSVIHQLTKGLCALHEAGKLHRDIKPSNVIVDGNGRCVVLDFGLVFDIESSGVDPQIPQMAGTYAYMAPEQAEGRNISEASDWYAVGATLFYILTGVLPFRGSSREVLLQKLNGEPPLASTLQPGIPEDLDQLCKDLLQRDPAKRPSGSEILQRLASGTTADAPAPRRQGPGPALFVGRAAQLGALRGAMTAVEGGLAVMADIHGVSGAGKSALVRRFLEELPGGEETVVLSGRCYEQESVPYKAVDSLIDALGSYLKGLPREKLRGIVPAEIATLAKIFPVLGWLASEGTQAARETPPNPVELRRQAFLCLRAMLSNIAKSHRVILYIDDIQWGDKDSATLLSEILRRPDEPPVLLICVSRSEYANSSECLRELRASVERYGLSCVDIPVTELPPEEALQIVHNVLGNRSHDDLRLSEEIMRESRGNAYFLRELLEEARSMGGLRSELRSGAPPHLDDLIWGRIKALPENARRLLEVVAVSGEPLAKADAYRAAGFSIEDPILLSALRAGNFIRSAGPKRLDDVVSFHDRVRETVLQRLPQEVLRDRHALLGFTFEASGRANADRLATHFDAAGNVEKARVYYPVAAQRASTSLAFDHAVRLYRRALELEPSAAPRQLRNDFADALANSGRGVEAARLYEQLARDGGPETVLDLQHKAAYQYCVGGLVEEGQVVFEDVIRRVGLPRPRRRGHVLVALVWERTKLLLRSLSFRERPAHQIPAALLQRLDAALALTAGLSIVDVIDAIYYSTCSVHLALKLGEPTRLVRALVLQAAGISASGLRGRRKAEQMLELAGELAARVNTPETRAIVVMCDGLTAFNLGQWAHARNSLIEAERVLRKQCSGAAWELATSRNMLLQTLVHTGDHREISGHIIHLKQEVKERGDLYSASWIGCHAEPMNLLASDRPGDALAVIDEALAMWKQKGYHQQHFLGDLTRATALLYRGSANEAVAQVQKAWPAMRKNLMLAHGPSRIYALDVLTRCLLKAAAGTQDRRALLADAEKAIRTMEKGGWYEAGAAWALAARACLANLRDQHGEALRLASLAAEQFSSLDMSLNSAAARRQIGVRTGGQEGKEQIQTAEAEMRLLGITSPAKLAELVMPGFAVLG